MKWFRLYSEFANDPKLKTFSKSQRYDIICLLCMANESKDRGVIHEDAEDMAATLDMTDEEYQAFTAMLERKNILSFREDGALVLVNFMKRQYDSPSDMPAETAKRKAKQRSLDDNEYLDKIDNVVHATSRQSHDKVTTLSRGVTTHTNTNTNTNTNTQKDTNTNTESIAETPLPQKAIPSRADTGKALQLIAFAEFYASYPVKKARQDAERAWLKIAPSETLRTLIMAGLATAKSSQEWSDDGGKYIPHPATFLNHCRWEDTYRPIGSRPAAQQQRANGTVHPNTMQGVIDDTARAIRAEEARQEATRQNALMLTADRKGLFQ